MDRIIMAVGDSRKSTLWKNTEFTWDSLMERLETTTRTPETQGEYYNMSKSRQDDIKDVGGFVGGRLKNGRRKAGNVDKRYLITLDADFAGVDFIDNLRIFAPYTWCVYSTHKHTAEKPRYRLLIPLDRGCSSDEYEAVARRVAQDIGIELFDDTTYQAHRLMYWPSTSYDGEYVFEHVEVAPLKVDEVLGEYGDWHDVSEWPTSNRTLTLRGRALKKQTDPTEKKGLVGAFCRTYTIPEAIEKYLSDVYKPCGKDRYTYVNGSTDAGVVLYDNDKFAYSNHATDPTSGMLCNGFDLVRIHKFGEMDMDAADGTPTVKLPSYTAMIELIRGDDKVKILMHKEKLSEASGDFKNIDTVDEEDLNWITTMAVDGKGRYAGTIDNVKKILENDDKLKNKLKYNEFTKRYQICGELPWCEDKTDRDWTDSDDAGLRHYIETIYGIKGKSIIEDAWVLATMGGKYHPVREYLNRIQWDGEKRLETLFIDYLGADDNPYTRCVTRKAFVAAVARVFKPGVKYDTMLTLVGPQGCGKSQMIKRMGGEWFSDTLTTMQGKEAYEQLQGAWIIEVGELAAMRRMEIESIKMFISKSEDAYRPAYGHHIEVYQRQCVFFGTTNTQDFLKDSTGNRRFWPIDIYPENATKNMWEELDEDQVSQIWAEAVYYYGKGEKLYIEDEEIKALAEEAQAGHLEQNPLIGPIKLYLEKRLPMDWDSRDLSQRRMFINGYSDFGEIEEQGTILRERVCPLEIWCELLGGEKKDFTTAKSREIRDVILQIGGWEQVKSNVTYGKLYGKQRGFIRKE